MTIGELKRAIADMPDDLEVILVVSTDETPTPIDVALRSATIERDEESDGDPYCQLDGWSEDA